MKVISRTTLFGTVKQQIGGGWSSPSENMRKLDRNRKETLQPFLSKEGGYEIEMFLGQENLLRELPIQHSKQWSTDLGRKAASHGGLCKLFHNSNPKKFLVVQIFHRFQSIAKLYSNNYPHINISRDLTDAIEKKDLSEAKAKKMVKIVYSSVPFESIFYLCNTTRHFSFGRYSDIINKMKFSSRNKKREDGSIRPNRLIFPFLLDVKYGTDFTKVLEHYLPK